MVRARVVLLLAVLAAAPAAPDTDPTAGLRILYPPTRSAVSRPVRLIVAAPQAADAPVGSLDGRPLTLGRLTFAGTWVLSGKLKETARLVGDRATTALWVAVLELAPGTHTVAVGDQQLALWSGAGEPPKDYTRLHAHAPVGDAAPGAGGAAKPDCSGCHGQTGDQLDTVPTPKACGGCHDEAAVQLRHRHVAEPLARCAHCHDPHGAVRSKLLVDVKPALCRRCHDAGHSKE